MAPKGTKLGLGLILVVMLWGETMAQSGCTTALISLSPCLTFVTGNTSSTPSSSCCSQLSNVVQSQPRCLCSLLNGGGANFGISINQTTALSLPGACNVQTPPVSQCNVVANGPTPSAANGPTPSTANGPTPSTADSPVGNSPSSSPTEEIPEAPTSTDNPTLPTTPSGGSKSGSSNDTNNASNGTITKAPTNVLVFALFAILCASTKTKF
ncbi:non-specific lipid-transfer protein-like protein [Tanacetum coccineum]